MLKVVSIEQVRAIEADADANGYSYADMMDTAGRAVADRALALVSHLEEPKVTIIVGNGNNGGDGLVAGLYLAQDNPAADVRFYLLADRDDEFTQTARQAGLFVALSEDDVDKRVLRNMVASADLLMDALFGIGVRIPIRDEAQKILRNANREINARRARETPSSVDLTNPVSKLSGAPIRVLAIDCPSGLDCDTGEVDKNAIPSDETITFIGVKQGQLTVSGGTVCGTLRVADIGISQKLEAMTTISNHVADGDWVKEELPSRKVDGHKGTYGRVLVVAGSVNYIGAPALSAEVAYRSGAGLVTVATPNTVILPLAGSLREVTWMMLAHDMGVIAEKAASTVYEDIGKMNALLVGPGLGTEATTGDFLKALLMPTQDATRKPKKRSLGFGMVDEADDSVEDDEKASLPPLVIDADGLNLLAKMDKWWSLLPEDTILTPHPGEMSRLCDIETSEVQSNRWALAQEKAETWGAIVVLKGAYTVVASPDGRSAVIPFAVDALATAGTGDILAGMITSLRAQGMNAYEAAVAGAYVHGLAGKLAGDGTSSRNVIAGDVLAKLGEAWQMLEMS
ncbi:MAG: NAD(P)H-hydrate dehydratase [Chloroflexota bacterium]